MNVSDLIINDKEQVALDDVLLSHDNKTKIEQLIKEHFYIEELHRVGLPVNNKLLLHGSSGCGKTTTAKAIAKALGKTLLILDLSNIVSARIGETSQHIKQVFDKAIREKAVLFLDEFDQVGKARGNDDKDVGEMRRLVNTLIQLIDYFPERSLLLGATNHAHIIDKALLRRFQLHIAFEMPDAAELDIYYDKLLSKFPVEMQAIKRTYNISYAEAKDDAYTQIKSAFIRTLENNR
jgi:SpoVK/Ycf46/Vps4 family AAA+-type ATPase